MRPSLPLLVAGGVVLALSAACHRSWAPTPNGAAAPPPSAEPVPYADGVTAAHGWKPADDSTARVRPLDLTHLTAFRLMSARRGGLRVLVYYNSALAAQVAEWRTPDRSVVELDFADSGPSGTRRGRRTLTLSSQIPAEDPTMRRDVDALVAHRIESAMARLLLACDTRLVDKAMLFRNTAAATGARTFSDAEIQALGRDVDLLLEVHFIPASASPDGFEVSVKAVRTRDARLLAWSSSANAAPVVDRTIVPVAGQGYREETRRRQVSLDDRASSALQLALEQVARTY